MAAKGRGNNQFSILESSSLSILQDSHCKLNIYEIKLGYVLYNVKGATQEPGTGWRKDAAFYAVPTWFVSCIYVNQGKKAWSPSTDIEQAKRSDIYQAIVLIDAQTGKMLPQEKSKHRGAADYRGILTWEDVQK